ncbi:MAG: hypothetical protein FWD26_04965 [Treponema sp.]|nr:hypothetical protein [Treponema sp.]
MGVKVEIPNEKEANFNDWRILISLVQTQGRGFIMLELADINDHGEPVIKKESCLAINHIIYNIETDETPTGSLTNNVVNYIHAKASEEGDTCSFVYSTQPGTWSADKGGFYFNNDRVIAKFFFVDGRYNGKVILDSFNAMEFVNRKQKIPETGGFLTEVNWTGTPRHNEQVLLPAGAYRYDIQGGNGGKGGFGHSEDNNISSGEGQDGEIVTAITGTFFWNGGFKRISLGQDGGKGQDGRILSGLRYPNGGGGGAGGHSRIEGIVTAIGGKRGVGGFFINSGGGYAINFNDSERGQPGDNAVESFGGLGGAAGRYLEINANFSRLYEINRHSTIPRPSMPFPPISSGHVKIWRFW